MGQSKIASAVACPQAVVDLVARFAEQRESYRRQTYNETQVRREFIDPFFTALGWDMDNRAGLAEAYKDVIHEDAIKVGGATKAPDYCFRIGGTRKFFVEAKKPAVGVEGDPDPAYQVRRYAWSGKLPLSIVTDFEEFAVYDCRIPPKAKDKASVARVLYLTCDQYAEKWAEIASIFSKDAILKGSFDKYAESNRRKKGTSEVDDEILNEIEAWREALAKNFALRNENLSVRDLNFAVERTIDRIIFLRMCEDRSIEPYGRLQALLNGTAIYGRLAQLFHEADDKYNAGLFYFRQEADRGPPDELTLGLALDDKVLKEIIVRLYYPESPYEFSVLPPEILGQVYEQFLGKVIRLTAGHRAVVEEKPEVRKAGGVYYTPTYIVDYIVKNTVGKLLEGKTPAEVGPERETKTGKRRKLAKGAKMLRVLDPACGSGSFLLGAYQYLLDWHRDWYVKAHAEGNSARSNPHPDPLPRREREYTDRVYQGAGGQWRLSIREKKRILLNNIYGVDIDAQAVEVTKLSLLLKVLEGETAESIGSTMRLFQERALPDLSDNIKCGNSLIGPDFYENRQISFDEEERYRINAFDWNAEFAEAMEAGGFDAVIGNPPYVRMEAFKPIKDYLSTHYGCHEERADLYAYFLERALQVLEPQGRLGFIVSNKFIKAKYGKPLRSILSERASVSMIADFAGADVFKGATVRTVVIIAGQPNKNTSLATASYVPVPSEETILAFESGRISVDEYAARASVALAADAFGPDRWNLLPEAQATTLALLDRNSVPLSEFLGAKALFGLKTGLNDAFIIDERCATSMIRRDRKCRDVLKPILFGKDIRRYIAKPAGRHVVYLHPDRSVDDYPAVKEHLSSFRHDLERRAGNVKWYELQQPAVALLEFCARPKIIYPIIANECRFTLESDGYLINDKAFLLPSHDVALLAVLNSRVSNFYFGNVCAALEGGGDKYLEFRAQYVDRFPIPRKLPSSRTGLEALASQTLTFHKSLAAAKTEHEKAVLQRQIDATNGQIDRLVYELYGLTEEELRIVEEGTK